MMRSIGGRAHACVAMLTASGVLACANASAPPGGPPDVAPPVLLSVTPSSGTTDVQPREIVLQFDEVISEIPRAAQDLSALVFISPKSGVPRVSWGRTRISIRPGDGFKPNTVYSVELRPGITDLRSNVIDSAIRVVFSTGGEIPQTRVSGAVFDWVAGRPAANALVEAITPDSTTYQTLADSAGRYELRFLPAARYVIRGVVDRNSNRELERLEPWDSTSLVVTANVTADLYTFQHDTLPMRIQTISYSDSTAELRLAFDKPFAQSFALTPEQFRIVGPDSTEIPIARVMSLPEKMTADSIREAQRRDSIAEAQRDTTAAGRARADSVERARVADSITNAAREAERIRAENLRRANLPPVRVDTVPPPKMNRPLPFSQVILVMSRALQPGATYRILATGLRSISGIATPTPARDYVVPRPPPPRDTTGRQE